MAKVVHESIEVNRCISCEGLWFDMLEEEHLKAIADSEEIDIGDSEVGKSFDAVDRITCPVCHTRMLRMVEPPPAIAA
jgi:Zn-finger nucleic acid-binding protein